jgi:hypothetical protein
MDPFLALCILEQIKGDKFSSLLMHIRQMFSLNSDGTEDHNLKKQINGTSAFNLLVELFKIIDNKQ